jgi:carboxypeptidase Taq
MNEGWEQFLQRAMELDDISSAIKLMHWDQEVMMPPKGGASRARALATLQAIAHKKLIDPEMGALLERLDGEDTLGQHQAASVRIMKRDHDKAVKVPESLVRELAELEATAYQVWTKAKPASDFSMLEPYLSKMVDLKKQQADAIGWEEERYDALLDEFEPGMRTTEVEQMLTELGESLIPLVDKILEGAGERPEFVGREFDAKVQEAFCQWLVGSLRYDLDAGRLDLSPHPFTMQVGPGDVRQTTRVDPDGIMMSIYAAIHETGHALYEQNLPHEWTGLPVYQVPSLGMHESQSRLWENQVGRGRGYSHFIFRKLREYFPEQLNDVDEETFYRGANHPKRTPIRVTADEVTYNLHVALRFELEVALFRDELDVQDLPGAWDEKMDHWVGIKPPGHAQGVLQDMHWSIGALGYFPTYSLGTLYAAAFFDKANRDIPELERQLAEGDVDGLLGWLQEHVYPHAYLYPAKELGEKILGEQLSARPFIDYLKTKFADMHDLTL